MADAKYRITNQAPRPTFNNNRQPIDVYDVFFEVTDTGDTGQISIPQSQYSAQRVHDMVQPLVNELYAARQLGGS